MLKLLVRLITIIAKHKGMDYITICWFEDTGSINVTGKKNHKKVYDWFRNKDIKWFNLM